MLPTGRGPGLGRASSEPVSPRTDGPTDTASLAAEGGRREAGLAGSCGLRTGSCSAVLSSPWSAERGWGRRAWGPGRTRPGPEPVALARAVGQGRVPRTQLAGTPPPPPLPLNPAGEEWSRLLSQDRTWGWRSGSWKWDPSCRGSLPPRGPVHPGTPAQPRPRDLRGDESQVGRLAPHTALVPGRAVPSVECALAQRGPALLGG